MQLTGSQFTNNTALLGIDLATFPDFPAEIRAPQGTLPGVSGFQLHFSSDHIFTPGDECDVLVAGLGAAGAAAGAGAAGAASSASPGVVAARSAAAQVAITYRLKRMGNLDPLPVAAVASHRSRGRSIAVRGR